MSSWQSQDWVQDDDYFHGYVTPRLSQQIEPPSTSKIYCNFHITSGVFSGYPYPDGGNVYAFDVNKAYHPFEMNNVFYGYPAAWGITFEPLGAFMNCTNLTSIEVPESVYELGPHTFFQSGLESVTIPIDCIFYETTFPDGCTISYYPFTTNISTQLPNILNTYCFDDDKLVDEINSKNFTITVNNKITRNLENYILADVDTSEEYTNVRGAIVGKSSLDDIGYFRYTTTAFDISDGLFEQGGLNSSGATVTDTNSIRSVNMFPSTGGLYRFIYKYADQSANLADPSQCVSGYQNNDGTIHTPSADNEITTDYIPFDDTNQLYIIVSGNQGGNINWVAYDANKSPLSFYGSVFSPNTQYTVNRDSQAWTYIRISWTNGVNQPICVSQESVPNYVPYVPEPPSTPPTIKIYRYTTDGSFISSSLLTNPLTVSNLNSDIDIGGATYMVKLVITNPSGTLTPQNFEYAKFVKRDMFNFSYCKDSNSNGATSKASTTNTVRCYEPCKLVLAVLHRPDITISDNSFTFLYTSTLPDTTRNQRISIWTKDVQAGTHSVTVTPSDPTLLYQSELLCIYDVNSISVYEDKIMPNSSYTVPAKESPCRRLYLSSSLYAQTNNSVSISITGTNSKSYTMNNDNFSSDGTAKAQNRYVTLYDYDASNTAVPTFSNTTSYTADSMNVVTLDIT